MAHEDARFAAEKYFHNGINQLKKAADILRCSEIDASPEAMRTEQTLSRAIDMLSVTGFEAPKRKG